MNAINNWVRQRTMEKISSILSHAPDQRTNVILASALYFNGEWNQHFIDTATKRYVKSCRLHGRFVIVKKCKNPPSLDDYGASHDNATTFRYRKQFFYEPNESIEVDMMYNGGPFPFYEDKSIGVKMVQLPYKGKEVRDRVSTWKSIQLVTINSLTVAMRTILVSRFVEIIFFPLENNINF